MLKQLVFETRKYIPIVEKPYEQLLLDIVENREDPVDTLDFFSRIMHFKNKFPPDVFNLITKSLQLLFAANVREIDKHKLAVWLVPHEAVRQQEE